MCPLCLSSGIYLAFFLSFFLCLSFFLDRFFYPLCHPPDCAQEYATVLVEVVVEVLLFAVVAKGPVVTHFYLFLCGFLSYLFFCTKIGTILPKGNFSNKKEIKITLKVPLEVYRC